MSDNQGERPLDETPADHTAAEGVSATDASAAEPTGPDAGTASETPAPEGPAGAPQAAAPQTPATPPVAPPAGWTIPARPAAPAGAAPAYARPQGYAGQPAQPQAYAGHAPYGQPPHGAAFGAAAAHPADAQPTLPITGAAPTVTAPKKQKTGTKVAGLIVAAALVSGAAGLGGVWIGSNLFSNDGTTPAAGPSTVTVNDTESVNQTTAIAAKVLPSVVTIEASGSSASGTGSGVILTSDGYVVTNTHVVTLDGASSDATIRVTTSDGRVFDAEIVGTDPTYDLAVIKLVDADGLTPVEFADSSKLNVGDQTIAVGAPLGLSNTVTTGIVSALNRSIEIASSAAPDSSTAPEDGDDGGQQNPEDQSPFFFDFGQGQQQQGQSTETIKIAVIQTDAAINPGNSGGALVDSEGKLIGINVAIASAGGSSGQSGNIGVGFSIPSDIVKRISDEIIADGSATHGLLGANVLSAAYVEGTTITGAYIDEAVQGGAAAEAGLQKGDIVTAFNGVPVTDSVDLTAQVRAAAAGSDATVTFVRDGKTKTVDVTLGELQ
ncbi:S1C family serine protease [Microbacterium sp.]|uniref:S1C family serine protease n=1 Tax=Microbacterium sp. TaxID=51671 RepID=UPI003F71049D